MAFILLHTLFDARAASAARGAAPNQHLSWNLALGVSSVWGYKGTANYCDLF